MGHNNKLETETMWILLWCDNDIDIDIIWLFDFGFFYLFFWGVDGWICRFYIERSSLVINSLNSVCVVANLVN